MKRILLLCLFLQATVTHAAITEVAGQATMKNYSTAVGSGTQAFPTNVTSGNLIVVAGFTGGGGTSVAVTDSRSTSYTVLRATIAPSNQIFIAYGVAPTSGTCTVTVDPSGSS